MGKTIISLIKTIMIVLISVVAGKSLSSCSSENKTVAEKNQNCYEENKDAIFAWTVLVEGFHAKPYFDGKVWTIGYGSTIYPDGTPVKKTDAPVSKEEAKEIALFHMDHRVWPSIEERVTRELTPAEMAATCSFVYNVGERSFKISAFLKAINEGKKGIEAAILMNGFRKSGGRLAKGLPKRHWIEGALFAGLLDIEDVYDLEPKRFYESDLTFYYTSRRGAYWEHDYSEGKVREFLRRNHSDRNNVRSLL